MRIEVVRQVTYSCEETDIAQLKRQLAPLPPDGTYNGIAVGVRVDIVTTKNSLPADVIFGTGWGGPGSHDC